MPVIACNVYIDEAQRMHLMRLMNSPKTEQRMVFRATVVLACADGEEISQIARRLETTRVSVRKWRDRFLSHGIDGLIDAPRSGQPKKLSAATVEKIVKTVQFSPPPKGATQWSCTSLAKKFGTNPMAISRILRTYGLKPHRTKTFKVSTDPQLIDKVHDVVGLYLNPPDKALVLCVDEKSQIQALDRTQPTLPLRPDQIERQTHDYVRHGTATLFAALDIQTGKVIGHIAKRHRHSEFLDFLKKLDRETPADLDLHLVLDNYGTHKHKTVRAWLALHPRFHLHFTPTSGSWMNLVESWFSILQRRRLKRGVFKSLKQLIQALNEYILVNNKNPKPFTWTKTANQILNHSHMVSD